jgi:hypothetical protein
MNQIIAELRNENAGLHQELGQVKDQVKKFEWGVNEDRKEEYRINVQLQKSNK